MSPPPPGRADGQEARLGPSACRLALQLWRLCCDPCPWLMMKPGLCCHVSLWASLQPVSLDPASTCSPRALPCPNSDVPNQSLPTDSSCSLSWPLPSVRQSENEIQGLNWGDGWQGTALTSQHSPAPISVVLSGPWQHLRTGKKVFTPRQPQPWSPAVRLRLDGPGASRTKQPKACLGNQGLWFPWAVCTLGWFR